MSFKFDIPASWNRDPAPPPPDLSSVDPHRIEGMVNRFIAAKQDALFTAPDAFYRQTGADAVNGAPAFLDRLAELRQSTLDLARDDNERAVLGLRLDLHVDDARDGIDRHVAKQQDVLARQIISERQTLIQRAAELDHNNDDKLAGLAEAHASTARELARLDGAPEQPAAESARSAIWRTALGQRLAAGDSAHAVALFDRIKDRLAPADRRHLDLPIRLAANDIAADRWIERATATPGEPLAARAAADPDLSPAEKASVLSKIAERTSATESARVAAVKGLDDKLDDATRALATAPATYKPATFLALANAYDDAGEPDKAAAARRLAQQENILLRFARSSVEEQQRLIDVLPADAQEAARAVQQQQDEAFARDPYAAGTALYPQVGPPLPAEDEAGRLTQVRMIKAMHGTAIPPLTGEKISEPQNDGANPNIVRVSLTPDAATSPDADLDGEQLAQANKPQAAPSKRPPRRPAPPPKKEPTPEELAKQAQRRADRAGTWDDIINSQSQAPKELLPDDWEATLNAKDARYANWTREAATRNGIPPLLLARLLYKESQYNPNASSLAGYKGIAQLGPGALQSIGIKGKFDYFDAKSSIDAGAAYLAWLHRGLGDWPRAVASYNAGLGNVGRWLAGDDIKYSPNEETKETIRHIFRGNPKAFDQ